MKKLIALLLLFILGACSIHAGDFKENRTKIHDLGQDEAYCKANPDRCIKNVPW
jgi:hypothetical protein